MQQILDETTREIKTFRTCQRAIDDAIRKGFTTLDARHPHVLFVLLNVASGLWVPGASQSTIMERKLPPTHRGSVEIAKSKSL